MLSFKQFIVETATTRSIDDQIKNANANEYRKKREVRMRIAKSMLKKGTIPTTSKINYVVQSEKEGQSADNPYYNYNQGHGEWGKVEQTPDGKVYPKYGMDRWRRAYSTVAKKIIRRFKEQKNK
jgi:hypothetical protein